VTRPDARGGRGAGTGVCARYTIKVVGAAGGLPGPVIAQLVPRTWADGAGWMDTAAQLRESVTVAVNLRQVLGRIAIGCGFMGRCRARRFVT
jgi:hypothetical protein